MHLGGSVVLIRFIKAAGELDSRRYKFLNTNTVLLFSRNQLGLEIILTMVLSLICARINHVGAQSYDL